MQRLYSVALPAFMMVLAVNALPTIPTLSPAPPPAGIAAAEDGTIYFVDAFQNTIWRLRPGDGLQPFLTGRSARSLQVDADGNLYGTHHDGRGSLVLWRADAGGAVAELSRVAAPRHAAPSWLVVDGGDLIGWTPHGRTSSVRLLRRRHHERTLNHGDEWGLRSSGPGDFRLAAIGGMAQDAMGDLVVTSGATVLRITRGGSVTTVADDEPLLRPRQNLLTRLFGEPQAHLTSVAVCAGGDIFVANTARNAVIRIDAAGRSREVHASESGWRPTGVATAGGVLYVLEYGSGVRVRRIEPDGSNSVVAAVRPARATAHAPVTARFSIWG